MSVFYLARKLMVVVLFASFSVLGVAQTTTVEGKITATTGQRIEVQFADGSKQWFSVLNSDAVIESSLLGKRVTGVVVKRGDASVLQSIVFSNQ